jgi:hypothetical protein
MTQHWHSTCYACGGRGACDEPNGPAFTTRDAAQADADDTNRQPFMRGFGAHHQTVESCTGRFCHIEDARP